MIGTIVFQDRLVVTASITLRIFNSMFRVHNAAPCPPQSHSRFSAPKPVRLATSLPRGIFLRISTLYVLYHTRPRSSRRIRAFCVFVSFATHGCGFVRDFCSKIRAVRQMWPPYAGGRRAVFATHGSPLRQSALLCTLLSRHTGPLSVGFYFCAFEGPDNFFKSFVSPLAFLRAVVYNNRRCWLSTHSQSS